MQWHSHFDFVYLAYISFIYKTFESTYLSNKLRNKLLGPGEKIPMKWWRNIDEKIIFVARQRRHVSSKQSALIRIFKSNKNWVISAVYHSGMAEGLSRIWENTFNQRHEHRCRSRQILGCEGCLSKLSHTCPKTTPEKMTSKRKKTKKTTAIHFIFGAFFQSTALQTNIFAQM